MKQSHLQHLYWRAGFGIGAHKIAELKGKSKKEVVSKLFKESKRHKDISIDLSEFSQLRDKNIKNLKKTLGKEKIQELQKKSRSQVRNLNGAWLNRLKEPNAVLREKMTLFWANIFVCKDQNIWNIQKYNNVLREQALGNFNVFTKAVSHEASMIDYLNNRQNKKKSPNENFARELMELFTLGAGNYSEEDIKASARSFTGWNRNRFGDFNFIKKDHDYGQKTFFDKTGNFDGNDIIDIITEQKQCARFICEKIYVYFINPIVDKNRLEELTKVFYRDYDIENLMRYIFMSDWFYDKNNIGVKIKSPLELILGINNTVPFKLNKNKQVLYLQKMMGQVLLYPVNVAGWKGGRYWIDSNTLMFRLKLPSLVLNNAVINLEEKGDIEGTFKQFYKKSKKNKSRLNTIVYWESFEKEYKNIEYQNLMDILISSPLNTDTENLIHNLKIDNIKDFCIQLMSIPEYQLC